MADLRATVSSFPRDNLPPLVCLAGGYASSAFDGDQSNNGYPVAADIIAGVKVAEVDYTSEHQPAFSKDNLRHYLVDGPNQIPTEFWSLLMSKSYLISPESLMETPLAVYIVSTYHNAYVNIVFGVRKIGEKGHQVVGISCMPPDHHVCRLDIDDASHKMRVEMTNEVEGVPMYHLLPELKHVGS